MSVDDYLMLRAIIDDSTRLHYAFLCVFAGEMPRYPGLDNSNRKPDSAKRGRIAPARRRDRRSAPAARIPRAGIPSARPVACIPQTHWDARSARRANVRASAADIAPA